MLRFFTVPTGVYHCPSAPLLYIVNFYDDWFESFLTIFSTCSVVLESEPWSPVLPLRLDWDSRRTRSEPFRSSIGCCAVQNYFTWDYDLLDFAIIYVLPYPCFRLAGIITHASPFVLDGKTSSPPVNPSCTPTLFKNNCHPHPNAPKRIHHAHCPPVNPRL